MPADESDHGIMPPPASRVERGCVPLNFDVFSSDFELVMLEVPVEVDPPCMRLSITTARAPVTLASGLRLQLRVGVDVTGALVAELHGERVVRQFRLTKTAFTQVMLSALSRHPALTRPPDEATNEE